MKTQVLGLAILVLITGCEPSGTKHLTGHIIKPARLFVHDISNTKGHVKLSAWVRNDEKLRPYTLDGPIEFVEDVPEGEPIWITINATWFPAFPYLYSCEEGTVVHLNSPNDLGGGGWNHGKHGSGMTNVL